MSHTLGASRTITGKRDTVKAWTGVGAGGSGTCGGTCDGASGFQGRGLFHWERQGSVSTVRGFFCLLTFDPSKEKL